MREPDEMSGSTPQTVIHTPFDMRQSLEFEINKEGLAPEFPRMKEIKTTKIKRKENKTIVHGQHNIFGASRERMI